MCAFQCYTHKDFDVFLGEYNIMKQKLDSKIQALLIITKELEHCRNERDHYKAMIEHIKPDQSMQKNYKGKDWKLSHLFPDSRSLKGQSDHVSCDGRKCTPVQFRSIAVKSRDPSHGDFGPKMKLVTSLQCFEAVQECISFLVQQLCEVKERDRVLQGEIQELKQKLSDANGDIKLLREQLAKQNTDTADDALQIRHSSTWERKTLVDQLESLKVKYILLEKDVQTILDEKEELITERDAYKQKVCRLNHELNIALKGDEKKIIDIDAILMENRYLQERLKQTQEEKSLYLQTLSKYKNMLEKRRNKSALKFGGPGSSNVIITHKQVEQMLQNTNLSQLPATQATVADLRSLALALFDSLNDKNIALSHQKKANKILGHRLSILEKQLSFLEISSHEDTDGDGSVTQLMGDDEYLNTSNSKDTSKCPKTEENSSKDTDESIAHQVMLTLPWEQEGNSKILNFSDAYDQPQTVMVTKSQPLDEIQESSACLKSPSIRARKCSGLPGVSHYENNDMTPELHRLVQDALEDLNAKEKENTISMVS